MISVSRISVLLLVALFVAAIAGNAQDAPAQKPPENKTLYQRIGGYDMIAKIVDGFLPRLVKEPKVANMISGLAGTSRNRNRQLIVDQICEATGGPCVYIGRSMEAAHQGLNIDDELWKTSQARLGETLDELKIKDPERAELLAIIEKLRPDIVEKKKDETKKPS